MTTIKGLPSDFNQTVCSANPYNGVFVATFVSADVCNSYAQNPVFGAPSAVVYTNCTVASICMSFNSPLTGSLKGFSVAGVTAQTFYSAALEFSTADGCTSAKAQGVMNCGGYGKIVCNNSSLVFTGCVSGSNAPIGSFSIPGDIDDILTFDLLP